jgi:hypothetical protein
MQVKRRVAVLILFCTSFVFSQAVTFHSPVPWITLRDSKIIAKTLVDTSEVQKNAVKLTLSKVVNGKKIRIASKKFKTIDYSQEYELATLDTDILGGKDFLTIAWEVANTEKKGKIEPFGIVKIAGDDPEKGALSCKQVSGTLSADALGSALKDNDFVSLGSGKFCAVWNSEKFGLVIKGGKDLESVRFSIDGKNGKNAFLTYSDRIITYFPKNDSLSATYNKRSVDEKGIKYNVKDWNQEIQKEVKDGLVCMVIPWYDLAILPIDGRIFGFAAFAEASDKTAAVPENAQKEIPGTWGNLVLKK